MRGVFEIPPFKRRLPWLSTAFPVDAPCAAVGPASGGAALARRMVDERLGGGCWADAPSHTLLVESGPGLAIVAACGNSAATSRVLLHNALARTDAGRTVLLLPREDAAKHRLRSTRLEAQRLGCRVVHDPVDPWPLLDRATEVHVATRCGCSHAWRTLAHVAGIAVHLDGAECPDRADADAALADLTRRTRYVDPFTGQPCTAEHALDLVAMWRRTCDANRRVAAVVGVQFWKRRRIAQFLHQGTRPTPLRSGHAGLKLAARSGGAIAAWASRIPSGLAARAAAEGVALLRIEDGFLRSVGLGSDFNAPCSIVLDGSGLYYDPTRPSDLETLLATHDFAPALLARADALVRRVVAAGMTKYNTGQAALPVLPRDGRRTILVPGQVADDLSVRLGAGAETDNMALLARVRADNPDAFIVYKPHPDVDAGHRAGALDDRTVLRHADALARGAPMAALISSVDELHTMTSLAGFEALLRGRRVVCLGRPFYAGWGLTEDKAPLARRIRRLSLGQLAAGVLLLYPRYVDPTTGLPCPAEVLIDRLAQPALWQTGPLVRLRRLQGRTGATIRSVVRGLMNDGGPRRIVRQRKDAT